MKLHTLNTPGSDYINANYIDVSQLWFIFLIVIQTQRNLKKENDPRYGFEGYDWHSFKKKHCHFPGSIRFSVASSLLDNSLV